MRKVFLPILSVLALSFTVVSCSDDDPIVEPPVEEGEEIVKQGTITANETWTADNIYVLDGRVVVDEGVTLTIEPGTIVKAEDGQGSNATTLIVDQGAKLLASGTADRPIIFTSVNDNIAVGETASTLDVGDAGQWGGVIVLGRAPISVTSADGIDYIEGIPADLDYGQYGGTNAADNSGSLKYVSIRFSGIAIAQDSEIQGLTLGGVGSGTTIENIEIFSNKDDGIEWFGGTVNVKNVVVYGQEDDGLDIDQAYSGTIDNAVVFQTVNSGSGLEIDGPEGNATGSFTMKNITIDMGGFAGKLIADFRDGAMGHLENIYVTNISDDGSTVNIDDNTSANNFNADEISFANWVIDLPGSKTAADMLSTTQDDPETDENEAVTVTLNTASFTNNVTDGTTGADLSVFDWTFAKAKGIL